MRRSILFGAAMLALGACTAFGPPAITLSRSEIAGRAFFDRTDIDVNKILKGMERLNISGPDVGLQTSAQRIEFAWTAKIAEGPIGMPLSLHIAISGEPVLNPQGNGIDLADTRIEEVRLPSVPFVQFDTKNFAQGGESLGTLPLLQFQPGELTRDGVVYQATGVSVGTFGLRVDLAPK
jgi:hypothetical protein